MSYHYQDASGIPFWLSELDPGELTVVVERSFDDDVGDRDSAAVLPREEVVALRDWLTKWLDKPAAKPRRREFVDGCTACEFAQKRGGFGPPHDASERCQSGSHEHCSCDTCF